uniref:CD59 molecule (CD59 blood group) n=1 Tax=Pipistrellus kuhlii TaxID=59472 RepID=A0A7J7WZ32_PIPKU|nr:CD59 molecule (CD59 blood group) [Pipistrellus kuhlii]
MGSKGGFTLLWLLIILSVLCDSGHGLRCYNCLNPGEMWTYYQCWNFNNCNYEYLSRNLGEKTLQYECCKKDLCNKSNGTSVTGTITLLVTSLLTAFWRLF